MLRGWTDWASPDCESCFEALILSTGLRRADRGTGGSRVRETGDRYSGEIAGKSP